MYHLVGRDATTNRKSGIVWRGELEFNQPHTTYIQHLFFYWKKKLKRWTAEGLIESSVSIYSAYILGSIRYNYTCRDMIDLMLLPIFNFKFTLTTAKFEVTSWCWFPFFFSCCCCCWIEIQSFVGAYRLINRSNTLPISPVVKWNIETVPSAIFF